MLELDLINLIPITVSLVRVLKVRVLTVRVLTVGYYFICGVSWIK